jgi:FKBP-type peptidyl-prolyl cis-trans isomerase 2
MMVKFSKGDRVEYSGGDRTRQGIVTSINANYVFVDFAGTGAGIATHPKDLKKI